MFVVTSNVSAQCSITRAASVGVCPCAREFRIVSDASCLWTVHVMDVVSVQVFSNCVFHFSQGWLSTAPLSSTGTRTVGQQNLASAETGFLREICSRS